MLDKKSGLVQNHVCVTDFAGRYSSHIAHLLC
jgi:hypothetical protein